MMMVSMRFSRWMVGYSPAVTADTNPSSKGEGICTDDVLIKCECVGILGLCKRKLQKRDIFPNFFVVLSLSFFFISICFLIYTHIFFSQAFFNIFSRIVFVN